MDCRYRALSDLPPLLPEVSPKLGCPLRMEQVPAADVLVQAQAQAWVGAGGPHSVGRGTRVGPMECMPVSHLGHLSGAGLSSRSLWSGSDIGKKMKKVEVRTKLTLAKHFKWMVHCWVIAYPEVGKKRGVGKSENRGRAHHCIAGTHRLNVHITCRGGEGGEGLLMLEIVSRSPVPQGLKCSCAAGLSNPTRTQRTNIYS